jgi:transposase
MPNDHASTPGKPRLLEAERKQIALRSYDLDSCVGEDHQVRQVWAIVEKLDLRKFEARILSRGTEPGRPAIDPKILITLWLQGTLEGIGSARELARACERDDVYRWICGGVAVGAHTLSDFRVEHQEAVDDLLSQVIAAMMSQGLVSLQRVAQDGVKIRASAGASSFRKGSTLERCYEEAQEQMMQVRQVADDPCVTERKQAARIRAAREREERIGRALAQLPQLEEIKRRHLKKNTQKRSEARVSTTDPDARIMKVADGGFRPAYNVQLAAETKGRIIVGVQVVNEGNDANRALPMLQDEIRRRTETTPEDYLIDGGFAGREAIAGLTDEGLTVYAGLKKPKDAKNDPYEPKPQDNEAYAALRKRMKTSEAKRIYAQRGALIETVNADLEEHRGLRSFSVRTLPKVTSVVLWAAIAYNMMRWISLTTTPIS